MSDLYKNYDYSLVFYNVDDLKRIFKCGRDKAYSIMSVGGFPSIKIGQTYLVEKTALENWIKKQQGRQVLL